MIHRGIYRNQLPHTDRLLALLNAKWVLFDRSTKYYKPGYSSRSIKKRLARQTGLQPDREFGNYQFYSVDTDLPFVYTSSNLHVIDGPEEALGPITQGLWPTRPAFLVASQPENKEWGKRLSRGHVSIVSYNPEEDERKTADRLPTQIVFDTQKMEPDRIGDESSGSVARKEPTSQLNILEDFFLPEKGPTGTWIWRKKNGPTARHISVINPYKKSLRSNFIFKSISFKTDRSLYCYLNGELLKVTPLKGDQPTEVIIRDLALKPGENIISFYTPFPGTQRGKENLSFGFLKSSFRFQNLVFSGSFKISAATQMEALIVPTDHWTDFAGAEQGFKPTLKINGSEVRLEKAIKNKVLGFRSVVRLNSGSNEFEFIQRRGANAAIFFSPVNQTPDNTVDPLPEFRKISPTEYKLKVSLSEPGYLVVADSFHPGWSLDRAGENGDEMDFPHFKVNGFANGFFLQNPGNYDLILSFKPQRLLRIGTWLTILGIILFFGLQYINRPRILN